ncbi:MAG: hypothetical protein QGI86_12525 [Candidatus Poribacteria bacterium]|nr:hypothetical protein [Candidatus Poribacteria bacterium]
MDYISNGGYSQLDEFVLTPNSTLIPELIQQPISELSLHPFGGQKTADGSSKPEANMEVRDAENEPKESIFVERNGWGNPCNRPGDINLVL